jgi:hypothetical protein
MTAPTAFRDQRSPPTGRELEDMLGPATELWARLLHDLSSSVPVWETWRFARRPQGWRLRLTRSSRGPALYLTPRRGHFLATFGSTAAGRSARLDVRSWRDLVDLEDRAATAMRA